MDVLETMHPPHSLGDIPNKCSVFNRIPFRSVQRSKWGKEWHAHSTLPQMGIWVSQVSTFQWNPFLSFAVLLHWSDGSRMSRNERSFQFQPHNSICFVLLSYWTNDVAQLTHSIWGEHFSCPGRTGVRENANQLVLIKVDGKRPPSCTWHIPNAQ